MFISKTFRHGAHPNANKHTRDMSLVDFAVPDVVSICLSQHIGAPAKPIVAVGDYVYEGQLIGEPVGFVSAPIFASVSGTVKGIISLPTATGVDADCIQIENDFKYDKKMLDCLTNPSADEILQRVKQAGIVGMGGATFPTFIKLSPSKHIDTLILNGAECEPYITCDYRIMMEKADDLIRGIQFMMTALGVEVAYIGIESNKPKAIKLLRRKVPQNIKVMKVQTKFPQGAEKQLIYAVKGRVVPAGGLPMDIGCVVLNIHTAYSVAMAMDGETLYKRAMTVSGRGVANVGNYWVRTGISLQFIYDQLRGDVGELKTRKIISGGPMMGFAQSNLKSVTTKGSSCLLFLTKKQFNIQEQTQCISCGRCQRNCPMHMLPKEIDDLVGKKDFEKPMKLGVMNCMECGACSYSCPAKKPLVQSMRLAKKEIKRRGL